MGGSEEGQLPGLLLLLSAVVRPQHRLVHHPGQQKDLLDLLGLGYAAELIVQCNRDLGLEQALLLVWGGLSLHRSIIVSKLITHVKISDVDIKTGYKIDGCAQR